MPKVTEQYREARRDEIAQAALRCFARKGFEATSMSDIIAESGLSAGAIYGHYRSKNDLIQAAISEVIGRRTDDLAEAMSADRMMTPGELIGRFIRGMRSEFGDAGVLIQLWAVAAQDPTLKGLASNIVATIGGMFHRYLVAWHSHENGETAAEAERLATLQTPVCLGLAQGYIVQTAVLDDFDSEAYLGVIDSLFGGRARSGPTDAAPTPPGPSES